MIALANYAMDVGMGSVIIMLHILPEDIVYVPIINTREKYESEPM